MSDLEVVTFTFKYLSFHGTKAFSPEYKKSMSNVYSGGDNMLHVGIFCKSLTTQEFLESPKRWKTYDPYSPQTCESSTLRIECGPLSKSWSSDHCCPSFRAPKKTPVWQAICKRRQCATSYHRLAINSWQQSRVHWYEILGTTLKQMLKFSSDQVRSDVPNRPHICNVYFEVRMQSISECLLPYQYFKILGA